MSIPLAALEEIIDTSGIAPRVELLLPAGVRRRQLRVRTLLAGMMLSQADQRPAHLTRVRDALTALPEPDQVRLGVLEDWKTGPHQLTYRQTGGPPLPWTVTTLGSLGTGGTPMVTKYQKFGDAYKAEAVKLYRESNQTIAETARNLGLKESTLANWVKKDKDNEAVAAGEAPLTPAERTRIRELEADVRRLNMENAFLKKASAYFASQNL